MIHGFQVDDATQVITSLVAAEGTTLPPAPQGSTMVVPTQQDYDLVSNNQGWEGTNAPRWKWVAGALQEQTDDRHILRFIDNPVVVVRGGGPVPVAFEVVTEAGVRRTGITGQKILHIGGGRRLRVLATAGAGTITIPDTIKQPFEIRSTPQVRLWAPLAVELELTDAQLE